MVKFIQHGIYLKWSTCFSLYHFVNKMKHKMYFKWSNLNLFSADPLVGSIATQYTSNREEHDRIAKLWTKRYAT